MKFETETKDFTRTPPSGFAAHLPFQGRHELGTDCAVSGVFVAKKIPLETFHRNVSKVAVLQAGHRAERSCSLRPRKAIAFLTHLLRVPRSMGTGISPSADGDSGGSSPPENLSPTALSWISLIGSHGCGAFLSLHDGFCVPFDKITGRDGVCYGLLLLRIFLIISSTSCFRCSSCFIAVSMLLMEYTMVE